MITILTITKIYESDELKIIKQKNGIFKVTDKNTENEFFWDYPQGTPDAPFWTCDDQQIMPWDFCEHYPNVIPILIEKGYLKECENGFVEEQNDYSVTYDKEMVHRIVRTHYYYTRYYKHNKLHRTDGPAEEYADGAKEWYINGKKLTGVEQWMNKNNYTVPFNKPAQAKFILTFT